MAEWPKCPSCSSDEVYTEDEPKLCCGGCGHEWIEWLTAEGHKLPSGSVPPHTDCPEALAIPLVDKHTGVNKWHYANGVEGLANELAQGFWLLPAPPVPAATSAGLNEPGDASTTWHQWWPTTQRDLEEVARDR